MSPAAQSKTPPVPDSFRKIRLELAREPGHPTGDPAFGYALFAPLDGHGRLDAEVWRAHRVHCRVVRFRPNGEEDVGHLVHTQGGSWRFHYDIDGVLDDESGFRLSSECFDPGEYVSVKSADGMHTYRVISVEPR
jgi:hypothetical protein